ncbi:hypothetical protein ACQP3J_33220, partial [Escherichia coli]
SYVNQKIMSNYTHTTPKSGQCLAAEEWNKKEAQQQTRPIKCWIKNYAFAIQTHRGERVISKIPSWF